MSMYFNLGSLVSALLFTALGLAIYFLLHTGPWTLALGFYGALCGWFYTAPPFKLVYRGLLEHRQGQGTFVAAPEPGSVGLGVVLGLGLLGRRRVRD